MPTEYAVAVKGREHSVFNRFTRRFNDLKTMAKLAGVFATIIIIQIAVVGLAFTQLRNLNNSLEEMYQSDLLPISVLGETKAQLYKLRGDIYKFITIPKNRSSIQKEIDADYAAVDKTLKQLEEFSYSDEQQAELESLKATWQSYSAEAARVSKVAASGSEQKAVEMLQIGGTIAAMQSTLDQSMTRLVNSFMQESEQLNHDGEMTYQQAALKLFIALGLALIISFMSAFMITSSINTPLKIMAGALLGLSLGNLNHEIPESVKRSVIDRKDEIGECGKALYKTENYLIEMVGVADTIAQGNLTLDITPRSNGDELSIALQKMIQGLRRQVSRLAENAARLSSASQQLSLAANQAGQAANQIVAVIQQVARGTSQQSESVSKTAASVEQMSRAIDGVAHGAAEQSEAITKTSTYTAQLSKSIQQVSGNVKRVTDDSARAAVSANDGVQTVKATLEGMDNIRSKVGFSAEKVQEMGSHSSEIGVIVETIEDIASQTNLLALNAAIEAARAGEHGKGFAVVADEVRKLAERSSNATKEISNLVRNILATVSEAVKAMEESTQEVEKGVRYAEDTGQSYDAILAVIQDVHHQAEDAARAAEIMNKAASELVNAMDSVSAVVEENTAATEQMAASSGEVTQAIENIASVSEENSAAVEEVSASAEEMSAQVEEVTASAQSLADMAVELQKIVQEFRLPA
jgi:methyl-accepting chemotaxis protein